MTNSSPSPSPIATIWIVLDVEGVHVPACFRTKVDAEAFAASQNEGEPEPYCMVYETPLFEGPATVRHYQVVPE